MMRVIPIDYQSLITLVFGIAIAFTGIGPFRRGCHSGECLSILIIIIFLLGLFTHITLDTALILGSTKLRWQGFAPQLELGWKNIISESFMTKLEKDCFVTLST